LGRIETIPSLRILTHWVRKGVDPHQSLSLIKTKIIIIIKNLIIKSKIHEYQ